MKDIRKKIKVELEEHINGLEDIVSVEFTTSTWADSPIGKNRFEEDMLKAFGGDAEHTAEHIKEFTDIFKNRVDDLFRNNAFRDPFENLRKEYEGKEQVISEPYTGGLDIDHCEVKLNYRSGILAQFHINKCIEEVLRQAKQKDFKYVEHWIDVETGDYFFRFFREEPLRIQQITGRLKTL